jgi:hypothetical protein
MKSENLAVASAVRWSEHRALIVTIGNSGAVTDPDDEQYM